MIYPHSFINYIPPLNLFPRLFISPPLSSFYIFLVNSYLSPAFYLFLIISSSLVVRFPLCSYFFSVTNTIGSPSCSFMFKNYNVSTCYSQHMHVKWHLFRLALLIFQKYLHLIWPASMWRTTQQNSYKPLGIIKKFQRMSYAFIFCLKILHSTS